MHHFRHHVLVFRHTARAAIKHVREVFLSQTLERVRNLVFSVRSYRMPVVLLITRECQSIERERIVFRRSHLLLDQRPQHPRFDFRQNRH